MREKTPKRIVGSDTPPSVPLNGRNIRTFRSYKKDVTRDLEVSGSERRGEKTRLAYTFAPGSSSGEFELHPTLWAAWHAFVFERIIRDGYITKEDAIHEAARVVKEQFGYGTSQTTRRYLKDAIGNGTSGDLTKPVWNPRLGFVIYFTARKMKELEALSQ